jgi:hypothetical protein
MYNTIEELEQRINFAVVELNGAAVSQLILCPKHSLFFCLEKLARHITYVCKINVANHKKMAFFLFRT